MHPEFLFGHCRHITQNCPFRELQLIRTSTLMNLYNIHCMVEPDLLAGFTIKTFIINKDMRMYTIVSLSTIVLKSRDW